MRRTHPQPEHPAPGAGVALHPPTAPRHLRHRLCQRRARKGGGHNGVGAAAAVAGCTACAHIPPSTPRAPLCRDALQPPKTNHAHTQAQTLIRPAPPCSPPPTHTHTHKCQHARSLGPPSWSISSSRKLSGSGSEATRASSASRRCARVGSSSPLPPPPPPPGSGPSPAAAAGAASPPTMVGKCICGKRGEPKSTVLALWLARTSPLKRMPRQK